MDIRLESLTIRAFRGIRGEERFEFGGQNSVIFGPNGSGKSTILQAIEFLLTGQISALRGSGTGDISVTKHVPNQYANPEDTAVQGRFSTKTGQSFRVVREFSNRSRLQAGDSPEAFHEVVTAANQGLLYLSRDELLELVIATPGNRKDQIYHLMNTEGLDGRRRQLKRLTRTASDEADDRSTRYDENLRQIAMVVDDAVKSTAGGDDELRPTALLQAINTRRKRLDGEPIAGLDAVDSFADGVTSPLEQTSNPLQRAVVQDRLETLHARAAGDEPAVAATLEELRTELRSLRADQDALDRLAEQSLIEHGLELVDETTTACPLCREPWEPGALEQHLEERADRLARIDARLEIIDNLATEARRDIESIRTTIDRVIDALGEGDLDVSLAPLARYYNMLGTVVEALSDELADDPRTADLSALELPVRQAAGTTVETLLETADALPDRSVLQQTWDDLQTLDETYQALQRADDQRRRYTRAADELKTAHRTFLSARDEVLGETFETISDRFAAFYEAVNPDESAFDPTLSQTNTGVKFAVDFYDTGEHPPHAMHSEGHQDLMGVCLFLALATELSPLDRLPVLLDDVVMSVDDEHREQFATVLRDELSDHFQLLLTTHDPRWARQLTETGVAKADNIVRFTDWTPDAGPTIETGLQ